MNLGLVFSGWSELGAAGLPGGWGPLWGAGLAFAAAFCGAGGIVLVWLGQETARQGPAFVKAETVGYGGPLDVLCAMAVSILAKLATAPVLIAAGWYGSHAGWFDMVSFGSALFMVLCGGQLWVCLWGWSRANALASSPMVNMLGCLGPVFGVALLGLAGLAGGLAWEYVVLGAALVALGNLAAGDWRSSGGRLAAARRGLAVRVRRGRRVS